MTHDSENKTVAVGYDHNPVYGLPKSLLAYDGKTFAVISLMQRSGGLNRTLKRELASEVKGHPPSFGKHAGASQADVNLVMRYCVAWERLFFFWRAARTRAERTGPAGPRSFALALDVQLLDEYRPEWWTCSLDEASLGTTCPEWSEIRERLRGEASGDFRHWPLGVFMVWPDVLADLRRWDDLPTDRRVAVGRAVFALSSIGYTDWFIHEALTVQPELQDELGALVRRTERKASDEAVPALPDEGRPTAEQRQVAWPGLLDRLEQLCHGLRTQPTRDQIDILAVLSDEFARWADTLPGESRDAAAECREKISEALRALKSLAADADFAWLDDELVSQLEARWESALAKCGADDSQLAPLTDDAAQTVSRGRTAADEYRKALEAVLVKKAELARAEEVLNQAHSFQNRRALDAKRQNAQRDVLDAEAGQYTLQDEVLAAWSPFSEAFDYQAVEDASVGGGADVVQHGPPDARSPELHGGPQEPPLVAGETDTQVPARVDAAPTVAVGLRLDGSEVVVTPAPVEQAGQTIDVGEQPLPCSDASGQESPPSIDATPISCEDEFSATAGEACQPIWRALAEGRLSLAFQLAAAMERLPDAPLVPHPELLSAVVLADRLVLPDGALKQALALRYTQLNQTWFSDEGPTAWRSAMNLLLVAATLRPMVLTPDIGASSVANYLRLDRHHEQLWNLVRDLGKLSDRLQGFRVDASTLRLMQGEAALEQQLTALRTDAKRWLHEQAPAVTIKFAAATVVWRQWLKPEGVISQMVAPVASNRVQDVGQVKELIVTLSDNDLLHKRIHETDRKNRTRGEDIHSGALEHLERLVAEALQLARRWVTQIEAQGQRGDLVRALLRDVRSALQRSRDAVAAELESATGVDTWGLAEAASRVVAGQLAALYQLFDGDLADSSDEPGEKQALAQDLLYVPTVPLEEDWSISLDAPSLVREAVATGALTLEKAFEGRAKAGDLRGAELLMQSARDVGSLQRLQARWKQELESFRTEMRRAIEETRREVEIGSAYSYLPESDRLKAEATLVQIEAGLEAIRRFDIELPRVAALRRQVERARDEKTAGVREQLAGLPNTVENRADRAEVEAVLARGDIATANEYLQRMLKGQPVWPDGDRPRDAFSAFFPTEASELESWLGVQGRDVVAQAIRQGHGIPGLDASEVESTQRELAVRAYSAWLDMKARRQGERSRLDTLLRGLGFTVQMLEQREKLTGRETWDVVTTVSEDRDVCPVPYFGSMARGRYRVLCIWERPGEEDIVQAVGEAAQQRPTIVLHFGRMNERRWRETSLLAKRRGRAFLLVDECILVRLAAEKGSRLAGLFQLTLPFAYSRPYDATAGLVPLEMFFGRSSELEAVCGLNGRCFIYGGRQLGKTALLRRAEQSFHAPSQHRYSAWLDLRAEGIGVSRTPSDVWLCITDTLQQLGVLEAKVSAPNPAKRGSVDAVIAAIKTFMAENGERRVMLLLDEADRFFEQDSHNDFVETRRLKQLMEATDRRFKVVFAGLHNVLRMTEQANHPLAHLGEPIRIGPFVGEQELREAELLVRGPMAAAGFEFESRSLVVRILAQTNYFPSLIQLYCHHLLNHMLDRLKGQTRLPGPRYSISDRDVEAVYSSGALRNEIRTRFRLTLQLDPRYELIAYALAYDLLRNRYPKGEGVEWQQVWQATAQYWWPEGFRGTSQLQFRNLLDEMVELGVLSKDKAGSRYTLRNPNVLLLLGTEDEIEAVLMQDRELPVEFESTTFHPPRRAEPASHSRHPLTYAQLEQLTRRENHVVGIAGVPCAGVGELAVALKDYLGTSGLVTSVDGCTDHVAFQRKLRQTFEDSRSVEGTTLILVLPQVPWTAQWVSVGSAELKKLTSHSRFATLLFVADPSTLSGVISDSPVDADAGISWTTLVPWHDGFVRHWLQEQHFSHDGAVRQRLFQGTGYWPSLLGSLVSGCTGASDFLVRIDQRQAELKSTEHVRNLLVHFGLDRDVIVEVLSPLAILERPMTAKEVEVESGLPPHEVAKWLLWASVLGLVTPVRGEYWQVDPFVGKLLVTVSMN